jgi:hypothetical protein
MNIEGASMQCLRAASKPHCIVDSNQCEAVASALRPGGAHLNI